MCRLLARTPGVAERAVDAVGIRRVTASQHEAATDSIVLCEERTTQQRNSFRPRPRQRSIITWDWDSWAASRSCYWLEGGFASSTFYARPLESASRNRSSATNRIAPALSSSYPPGPAAAVNSPIVNGRPHLHPSVLFCDRQTLRPLAVRIRCLLCRRLPKNTACGRLPPAAPLKRHLGCAPPSAVASSLYTLPTTPQPRLTLLSPTIANDELSIATPFAPDSQWITHMALHGRLPLPSTPTAWPPRWSNSFARSSAQSA